MLTIAGGILLAVAVLYLLPEILTGIMYLLWYGGIALFFAGLFWVVLPAMFGA